MININDKQSKGTHWVSLFIEGNTAVYFDSMGIGHIPQEVLRKIKDKSTTPNIFKKQDDDSIVWILLYHFCRIYACRKNYLRLYPSIFPKDYRKNKKVIYKNFKDIYNKRRHKPWI